MRHAVYVLSYNRPHFLKRTLESLLPHCERDGIDLCVIDDASGPETRALIESSPGLCRRHLLEANVGICAAFEGAIPADVDEHYDWITTTADDVRYVESPRVAAECLAELPDAAVASLQHSPEHRVIRSHEWRGRTVHRKPFERGTSLTMSAEFFQGLRPLPIRNRAGFDWWVVRDAPRSAAAIGRDVVVLPGAARHLGWRKGDSPWPWQGGEIPEYEEFRE